MANPAFEFQEVPSKTADLLLQRDAQSKLAFDEKKLAEEEQLKAEQGIVEEKKRSVGFEDVDSPQAPQQVDLKVPKPEIMSNMDGLKSAVGKEAKAIQEGMTAEDNLYKAERNIPTPAKTF